MPYKMCNLDCIYCQLGPTAKRTLKRKQYIKIKDIISELSEFINSADFKNMNIDYISLSGTGEPLLNSKIDVLIDEIKKLSTIPIALITNASLFKEKRIRDSILGVDLIMPSLDAIDNETFKAIDRPAKGLCIEDIIKGLVNLRNEFGGKIFLEIMIVKGVNDNLSYFQEFKHVIARIDPDKVHLNVPKRHTSEAGVSVPDREVLKKICKILGDKCEII